MSLTAVSGCFGLRTHWQIDTLALLLGLKPNQTNNAMAAKSHQLLVNLGASQTRRRLKGHGFGVKKIETAGKGQAVITHTATGEHLAGLRSLFADVLVNESEADARDQVEDDLL